MPLSRDEIVKRLNPNSSVYGENRIIVTPLLDPEDQIGTSGIDLRLGKQFILFKSHLQGSLKPERIGSTIGEIFKYQEEHVIGMNKTLVLHPNQFVLGSSLEYIGLPIDLEARIDGRSSWARIGLLIATATTIHPGFQGVVTLELSNHGSIPIELYPGLKIAYMTFEKLFGKVPRRVISKYDYSIGPGYSKISADKGLKKFLPAEEGASRLNIRVILEPNDEGGYTAHVPSLPGCISQGDSREEALANIREAIELYLEPEKDDLLVEEGAEAHELEL
ncbi:MAG: dCTP deaminase [Candidatus Marinimicrobia bacterium]|nr:dCTP deaminase [Candidatus Neomarinimicrobiota bacterium]